MGTSKISPPSWFRGREQQLQRFKARLDHFRFFVYGGIPGIGKTALSLRLLQEASAAGCKETCYLRLAPGETILSILARVEARYRTAGRTASALNDKQGDPYGRLIEVLSSHQVALILDDFHNVRGQDVPAMTRAFHGSTGPYVVIATQKGEPELSAMDRMLLHMERLGALTPDEAREVLDAHNLKGERAELLAADAARGGCSGHPLTLNFMATALKDELPDEGFLSRQSSRSFAAFQTLLKERAHVLQDDEHQVLEGLCAVGRPVSEKLAVKLWGKAVERVINIGLVMAIEDSLHVHTLVKGVVGEDIRLPKATAKQIATYLKKEGAANNEPVTIIRAGELLARSDMVPEAVELLSDSWEEVRDLGFLEAFLKTLNKVSEAAENDSLKPKIKLLAARARMRQGNVSAVRADMEELAASNDTWTKRQALAALTYIYHDARNFEKAVEAFDALSRSKAEPSLLVPAGVLAAEAMQRLGNVDQAEKLAKGLLKKVADKKSQTTAELHRILSRAYAGLGRLDDAVQEAKAAAEAFEASGDLYHAATGYGFIGDLYRDAAEFEKAKAAFQRFRDLATEWGERDLIQVAELSDAWVSIDIGDLNYAARQVEAVEKDLSAAASRRLRRYLGAAKALVAAGRGDHEEAARSLRVVIDSWREAGQHTIADILRANLVRSLLALGRADEAEGIVEEALSRLDEKTAAPRVAMFLREKALIHLQRQRHEEAMKELARACRLFSASGNRREEVMTLYRISQAALQQDDLDLAKERAKEATTLAAKIRHTRAIALASEVSGKVALAEGDAKEGVTQLKKSLQALKKLGDELGTLHVSEALLRAYVVSGDLSSALKLGPRVAEHAEKLELRDSRIRAIVYTGVALLRREKMEQARRCFKELPAGSVSPTTALLMWRFGEALAVLAGSRARGLERRERWVTALKQLPEYQHEMALRALDQLALPPRDQAIFRAPEGEELVGTEYTGYIDPSEYELFIDVYNRRIFNDGKRIEFKAKDNPREAKVFFELVIAAGRTVSHEMVYRIASGKEWNGDSVAELRKANKDLVTQLQRQLKLAKHVKFKISNDGIEFSLPKDYGFIIPTTRSEDVTSEQRKMIRILRKHATLSLTTLQEETGLPKAAARSALAELEEVGLVEAVRDGRGQAFRLV